MYIKRYFCVNHSMCKVVELFSTNNKGDIQNLATYVYKALVKEIRLYIQNMLKDILLSKCNNCILDKQNGSVTECTLSA